MMYAKEKDREEKTPFFASENRKHHTSKPYLLNTFTERNGRQIRLRKSKHTSADNNQCAKLSKK